MPMKVTKISKWHDGRDIFGLMRMIQVINMRILSLQPMMDAQNVFLASKFVDKILWSKEKTSMAVFFLVLFTSKEFTK